MTTRRSVQPSPDPKASHGGDDLCPERLAVAEERLVLHELIRVGVARQEDLRLLQSVAFTNNPVHAPSAHVIRECSLREEWRCAREQRLLSSIGATSLLSCSEPQTQQQLSDQLRALRQIEEEQRALLLRKAKIKVTARSQTGGLASPSRASPSRPSDVPHRLPLYPGRRPRTSGVIQQRGETRAGQAGGGAADSRLNAATVGHGSNKSGILKDFSLTPTRTSPYTNNPVVPTSSTPGRKAERPPLGRGSSSAANTATLPHPRPISAPPDRPSAFPKHLASGKQALESLQGQKPKGTASGSGIRFQQLYHLHGTLLRNLEGHKAASGADGATLALQANISEAQDVFVRCMHEAMDLVEALEQQQLQQNASRPGTKGGQGR